LTLENLFRLVRRLGVMRMLEVRRRMLV